MSSCCHCSQPQPCPWLLYVHGKGYTHKTFHMIQPDSLHQHPSRRCNSPELRGKQVIASFPGWLLLLKVDHVADSELHRCYTLWNPFNLESIDLPPLRLLESHKRIVDYVMLSPDVDGEEDESRKMVTLLLFETTMPCIFVYWRDKFGGGQWRSIRYGKEIKAYYEHRNPYKRDYPLHLEFPVCCNGKLYAFTHNGQNIVEIDLNMDNDTGDFYVNNGLVIRPLGCDEPRTSWRSFCMWQDYVGCDREMFYIQILFGGINFMKDIVAVEVFKFNFSKLIWEKLDSLHGRAFFLPHLQDRAFFLCHHRNRRSYGLRVGVGQHVKGNCIYFTMSNDKYLYCYNMEDNSVAMSLPCPDLPTPWLQHVFLLPNEVNCEQIKLPLVLQSGEQEPQNNNTKTLDVEGVFTQGKESANVCDLSLDVLKLIAEKLILFDYMNFRVTCTMFLEAAPPLQWRSVLTGLEVASSNCLSPAWLMLPGNKTHCDNDVWSFVVPHIIGSRYLMTSPELLKDVTICCSKDGWLLLACSEKQDTIVFFNPFTKAMIELPNLDTSHEIKVSFTFSSSPTSDNCTIIAILAGYPKTPICFFSSGKTDWECIKFENNLDFMPNWNNPVFWNGSIYFLGQGGNLGVLTIHGEDSYGWEVLDKPKKPCNSFHQNFLLECGGVLLSVFVGYMGRKVDVFKLIFSKLVWEKVDNLGNYVLFLSHSSSFSTLARSSGMENRIYFPRFRGENLVYYSLSTCKFHSIGSDDSLLDYCGTKEQLLCCWIEPRWC